VIIERVGLPRMTGLVLLPISAFVIYEAFRVGFWVDTVPGPGFLGLWLGLLMAGCAVWFVVTGGREWDADRGDVRMLMLHAAALTGLVIGISFLGVLVTGALYLLVTVGLINKHRWVTAVLVAAIVLLVVWLGLVEMLGVALPRGTLFS
jgi:Tripartite tricarboxylate transporter TctB family